LKINVLDLEFSNDYYYIQNRSIVKKVIFNNRTFYSKFEKITTPLTSILLKQHLSHELTLATSLIEKESINYIVIEYYQKDWLTFYSLLKYLLKSLNINKFQFYRNPKKELLQLFIFKTNMNLKDAFNEVENIKYHLELKSKKSYKIYPNINLPKNYNIITLPIEKI